MSSEYDRVGSSLGTGCDTLLDFSQHRNLSCHESGGCHGDGGRYVMLECPVQGSPSGSYAMWCWNEESGGGMERNGGRGGRGMDGEGAEEWRERGQRNGGRGGRGMEGEEAEEWRERGQRNGWRGGRGMEGEGAEEWSRGMEGEGAKEWREPLLELEGCVHCNYSLHLYWSRRGVSTVTIPSTSIGAGGVCPL